MRSAGSAAPRRRRGGTRRIWIFYGWSAAERGGFDEKGAADVPPRPNWVRRAPARRGGFRFLHRKTRRGAGLFDAARRVALWRGAAHNPDYDHFWQVLIMFSSFSKGAFKAKISFRGWKIHFSCFWPDLAWKRDHFWSYYRRKTGKVFEKKFGKNFGKNFGKLFENFQC